MSGEAFLPNDPERGEYGVYLPYSQEPAAPGYATGGIVSAAAIPAILPATEYVITKAQADRLNQITCKNLPAPDCDNLPALDQVRDAIAVIKVTAPGKVVIENGASANVAALGVILTGEES